ncbi:N-acetylglutaminylglutamine amidotransferase [Candidatus Parabeggiatoa sp. HSG14]|uniref:N-acetylglutaminylglutamine amidotransferase n=1 Tax=Candidatus Parabeggiatoa sp. HSG14 TaxID=3055593 RepID=UPI0025A73A21|nr:N-acetylglutaminylglutamine amidotransferase [Thiotrichales bacterium HSG14]
MCGICGELGFGNHKPDRDTLFKMMDSLARRGPDDAGDFLRGPISLGHQRLSVIDLSKRAHQPLVDENAKLIIVFNGTIYNYRDLHRELLAKGHNFHSKSDTEVVLKSYLQWKEKCVEHLHGMFAFALWDDANHKLFLARDRLGIKPLYYCSVPHGFRFASTLPALLAGGDVNTRIDPIALHHHLTLHGVVPAPRTLLRGVQKLPPGTTLTIPFSENSKPPISSPKRYWQLQARRPEIPKTEKEWIEAVRTVLKETVDNHLRVADVPVGVLLSGGLDSSLLVGLLAENENVENLFTFSIGFEDTLEERGSEFEYSDQVVARYHTNHHRYIIPNEQVLDRLPEAITAMSEPMVGQDAVAFYLLAEQVSQVVKVVQSGQGADEVFAGYFWYPLMNAAQGTDLERFKPYYFDRDHEEFLKTVRPYYYGKDYTSQIVTELLAQEGADTFLDKVLRMDVTTLIVDDPVKRLDNMTMAYGLEARVPFLDHHLVELAASMPPELKLRENGKYVLKKIAHDLLPAAVIDRPKGYFPMPALRYVRGPFLEFMRDVLNSTACRQRQLFQRNYVDQLLATPEEYKTPLQGSKLWHLALLEKWLQIHVDGKR